jgi:hypothetical protein
MARLPLGDLLAAKTEYWWQDERHKAEKPGATPSKVSAMQIVVSPI